MCQTDGQPPEGGQAGIKDILVICDDSSECLQESPFEVIKKSLKSKEDS